MTRSTTIPVLAAIGALLPAACGLAGGDPDAGDGDAGGDPDPDSETGNDVPGDVWRVRAGAAPGGDGLTWETAFADLQDGLAAASGGDEIWVAAGTYRPTAGVYRGVSFVLREGAGVYGGFAGTEESRDERDWEANGTVLSGDIGAPGDAADNSFHVVVGADGAALDGFTITGGRADWAGDGQHRNGGGLLTESAHLVVANCAFTGNSAGRSGGGLYDLGGIPELKNCAFTGNTAGRDGGGIAFAWSDSPQVTGCAFSGNSAGSNGGGLYGDLSNPRIAGCAFTGNIAGWDGGGLFDTNYFDYYEKELRRADGPDPRGGASVAGCVFAGNSAGSNGGGMSNVSNSPTVAGCVFAANSAGGDGGGMHSDESNPHVANCTFSGNEAGGNGGGIGDRGGETFVFNTIFWGNAAQGEGDSIHDQSGYVAVVRSCVEGGWWDPGGGVIELDPSFAGADDPAGPDGVWMTADDGLRLAAGSPCIDAADGDAAPDLDLLGNPRFDHPNAEDTGTGEPPFADIGACEYLGWNGVWRVMEGAAPGGDGLTWETAFADLQDGLAAARGGEEIWVAAGTYLPTAGTDRTVSFAMPPGVGIYGGFAGTEESRDERDWEANGTVLSGDIGAPGDAADNSFHVVVGADGAALDGFTITGGRADGSGLHALGGGALNLLASPRFANCAFTGNAARGGGGMFNGGGSPVVVDCTFVGNAARYGGGLCNGGSDALILDCAFAGNLADGGGGALNLGKSPVIENCVFSGNEARFGGGMHNHGQSAPAIANCTFQGNAASHYGGGISSSGSQPAVVGCVLWGNTAGHAGPSIHDNASLTIVSRSVVAGGHPGDGNIDQDPRFEDATAAAGADGIWRTADDGLRPAAGSPCIDAADGDAAPDLDILGRARVDHPEVADTGVGEPPYADIGAYEHVF